MGISMPVFKLDARLCDSLGAIWLSLVGARLAEELAAEARVGLILHHELLLNALDRVPVQLVLLSLVKL